MKIKKKTKLEISDWELLEDFQRRLASKLETKYLEKKLSDLLKIVELKYKIKDESQREKIFWEMVEDLRKGVLGEPESRKHKESESHKVLNHGGTRKRKNKIAKENSKQDEIERSEMNQRE
ncbi:MAG: hypothetical protein RBG1_1C00001G1390 [candidate division Zixibacteria bacterium RBG-1]|nr:MAG: hypothetical protein RBG1_1C00001G1390 [candidate division Zixibacteria bacterium RBG-1]OGC85548.1 MAG: hypothetical protein A2V73_06300 [candidate division Zixibacteria bacterium RBG_19FT_COMBO_42_43]